MGIFDWLCPKQKQPASEESRVAVAKKTRKHPSVPELKEAGDVAGLIQVAQGEDKELAWEACKAILDVAEPDAVEDLIGALSSDYFGLRNVAAEALGNIGDQRAFEPLLNAARFEERRPKVFIEPLNGMDHSGRIDVLVSLLSSRKHAIYDWAIKAIGRVGKPALPALTESLQREGLGQQEAYHHALALKEIDPAIDYLLELMGHESEPVREAAVKAFEAKEGTDDVAGALLSALEHDNPNVRVSAAAALGRIGDADMVEVFLPLLKDDSAGVREAAVGALGNLGDQSVVESLIPLLDDPRVSVRERAAAVLGNLGDPRAVEGLMGLLGDQDSGVRLNATYALGQIGDPKALPALTQIAREDEKEYVRKDAALALGMIEKKGRY